MTEPNDKVQVVVALDENGAKFCVECGKALAAHAYSDDEELTQSNIPK